MAEAAKKADRLLMDSQTDDDSFVNVPALLTYVRSACAQPDCKNERAYMGFEVRCVRVHISFEQPSKETPSSVVRVLADL